MKAKTQPTRGAKPRDLVLAKEYARRLQERLGDKMLSVVLFGSRARGDAQEGSDFDFVICVRSRDNVTREVVLDVSVEMMDEFEELFSGMIYEMDEWCMTEKLPFGWNVRQEGIEL